MIRKATLKDVKPIHRLIAEQAGSGHILARAMSELYGQIRDFTVAQDDRTGEVIGCGALQIVWEDLAEIRSLAVQTAHQRAGLGSKLIESLMQEARNMGVKQVFVLTYRQKLFERFGFNVMNKNLLPHKIWADCIRCTKFPECDEIALVGTP
ncbi:MAG TPA: N-acetyltransferase [Desulfomonilaceae bacterium]|nr:N-acetyltransferase [Desulfomonilaceae bacterium]